MGSVEIRYTFTKAAAAVVTTTARKKLRLELNRHNYINT